MRKLNFQNYVEFNSLHENFSIKKRTKKNHQQVDFCACFASVVIALQYKTKSCIPRGAFTKI